ncbi:hypothetical protein [Streptomyces mayteni]
MSGEDGTEYLPDGLRSGAQGSYASSDAAEDAHRYLRIVEASPSAFGGAEGFTNAVNNTRDEQSRGVQRAAEDRQDMGDGGYTSAAIGEDTDAAASHVASSVTISEVSRQVADGV